LSVSNISGLSNLFTGAKTCIGSAILNYYQGGRGNAFNKCEDFLPAYCGNNDPPARLCQFANKGFLNQVRPFQEIPEPSVIVHFFKALLQKELSY